MRLSFALFGLGLFACAGASEVTPKDLGARDLLGLEPSVALEWSSAERSEARRTLTRAMSRTEGETLALELAPELADDIDSALIRAVELADQPLAKDDAPPRMMVHADPRAEHADVRVIAEARLAPSSADSRPEIVVEGWDLGDEARWRELITAAAPTLSGLAAQAGHTKDSLTIAPAPRVAVAALYDSSRDRLLVNPVLVAALAVDDANDRGAGNGSAESSAGSRRGPAIVVGFRGNNQGQSPPISHAGGAPDASPDPLDPSVFHHSDAGNNNNNNNDDGCGCNCKCGDGDCGNNDSCNDQFQCNNSNCANDCGNQNCGIHRHRRAGGLGLILPFLVGLVWVRRRLAVRTGERTHERDEDIAG